MDSVTQLQDGIDQLSYTLLSSIDYLHSRAPLLPLDSQNNETLDGLEEYNKSKLELAKSICNKVLQNNHIIELLPNIRNDMESMKDDALITLNQGDNEFNELVHFVNELEMMRDSISNSLKFIIEDQFGIDES